MAFFKDSVLEFWYQLQFEFQPCSCWCCGRGFGRALCRSCMELLPWASLGCKTCGYPLAEEAVACGKCLQHPPPFEELIVAQQYQWPWTIWIPDLKFKEVLARGHLLAHCLRKILLERQSSLPEVFIPVPLHPDRERERGFNQAKVIALPLARWFKRPLGTEFVIRKKATRAQSTLSALQRKKNLENAFEVRRKIPYRHVAIVDDVITTMSTVTALAHTLKQGGVQKVTVLGGCRA